MSDLPSGDVQGAVSFQSALSTAARLLDHAELECDLAKMERYEKLADSWINIASMLKPEGLL